jgi:hypothetical protein
MKNTTKRTFAPVTSVSLRRDGLHVMAVGNLNPCCGVGQTALIDDPAVVLVRELLRMRG